MLRKVWAYFDQASSALRHRLADPLPHPGAGAGGHAARLGVRTFAPLVYPHKPGMARWLTEWVTEFAAATPDAVPTATLYPEPDVADYLGAAVDAGARAVKVHVQVGGVRPARPAAAPGVGAARRGRRARRRALRPRADPGRAHRARRLRRGPRRAPRGCAPCSRTPGCPTSPAALDLVHRYERRAPRHHDGRHRVQQQVRAAADGLAGAARGRRRPGGVRLGLPEHPLPVRGAGAGGRGMGGCGRPPRRPVPPFGPAHAPARLLGL